MKLNFILVGLTIGFSTIAHAQVQSAANKNQVAVVAASNPVKTSSLTISLTVKGAYTLGSDQDKNLKKSGILLGATHVAALNKELQEAKNGASDVAITIRAEHATKFQYLVSLMSTVALQTTRKFVVATETSQCTVQVPLDGLPKNVAYLTVQISPGGDYALQRHDKDGKSKGAIVAYKHDKIANLNDALVQARNTHAASYALINADKDAPIQAYVDLINMLNSASIDRHMIVAQSGGGLTQNAPEKNQHKAQQLRIDELEEQQKQLLEQLKKMK